ncbi:hypothetical protein [Roseateles flavus]|uniref:Uncharacterized protein n=1 Tax=Roseateles flavus TaxID=3149041 RepID=A0ABV0G8X2_9BURK
MSLSVQPTEDENIAGLVSGAMFELLEAMHIVCVHLRGDPFPFDQNEHERLVTLVEKLIGSAEELCRAADVHLIQCMPAELRDGHPSLYAELACELAEVGRLLKPLLKSQQPSTGAGAEAMALIARISRKSSPVLGKPS